MKRPPNFLFLFPDQWRGDWMGYESNRVPVRTPNLDALAAQGTRFTHSRSNSPLCIPARACLAQGVRYERCGVVDNSGVMDPTRHTFFKVLRDAGYRTLTCGKSDLHGHSDFYDDSGWHPFMGRLGFTDSVDMRGKINSARRTEKRPGPYVAHLRAHELLEMHREDYHQRGKGPGMAKAPWPTPLPRRDYCDDFCGRQALHLLNRTPVGAPWLLWVNFPGPHDPFDPPRELQARFDGVEFPAPIDGETDVDHQQIRRNYAAMISGIDEWAGWLVDEVRRRGELDNTVIVFCSDHGEMLGDHARWQKAVWHEPSVRVPCFVTGPGLPQGIVDDRLVELIDIGATILDAAGLEPVPGCDARSVFAERRDLQFSGLGGVDAQNAAGGEWRMVCDSRWKYVTRAHGDPILTDLLNDPHEMHNLWNADHPEAQRLNEALAAQSARAREIMNGATL